MTTNSNISSFRALDYIEFCLNKKKMNQFHLPSKCMLGFIPQVYSLLKQQYGARQHTFLHTSHPISLFTHQHEEFAFVYPGTGAPQAAMILDELIQLGAKTFLFFGPAGIIDPSLQPGKPVIVESAWIDEGTSAHYGQSADFSEANMEMSRQLLDFFRQLNRPAYFGKTWTTDAPYRETRDKINKALHQQCLTVDMEASALFSVSQFYNQKICGFLLPRDQVSVTGWSSNAGLKNSSLKIKDVLKLAIEFLKEKG